MISPRDDEEFGPFGRTAIMMLDFLFPNAYQALIIVSPSFNIPQQSNISPQFARGEFCILSSVNVGLAGRSCANIDRFTPAPDIEVMLDRYRYEHVILTSLDLGIITAWAQAEYAVVAFRNTLLNEYGDWFKAMQTMDVLRRIP